MTYQGNIGYAEAEGASASISTMIDVVTESPADNEVFTYNATDGIWENTPIKYPVRVITAAGSITIAPTDSLIVVNKTSGAATTVDLPDSTTIVTGAMYTIKDGKGDANTNNITIDGYSAETIDGVTTLVMSTDYQTVRVIWNGTEWNVI